MIYIYFFSKSFSTKTFVIDHPLDENKHLVHACLEGPESGVYYRGKAEIKTDSIVIDLPSYADKLAGDFTVQLTPIGKESKLYTSSEVENGKFTVYGKPGKFYWLVMGNRFDIEVEPLKDAKKLKSVGPYTWLE